MAEFGERLAPLHCEGIAEGVLAVVLNAWFVIGAYRIWRRDEAMAEADKYAVEKAFFRFSLLYLFLHFAAFLVEAALKPYGLGGW